MTTHPSLSFAALETRIAAYLPDTSGPLISRNDLIAAATMAFGILIATVASTFFPSKIAAAITFVGLAIELSGALLMLINMVRNEFPQILHRRRIFAAELDQQSDGFNQIVNWLKIHPQRELEEKLFFVRKRLEPLTKRSGFLFGGMERLGFLPVLIALYLQFKDAKMTWPPNLNTSSGFLGLAIFVLYAVGLWAMSLKWQLESYVRFLEMATQSLPSEKSIADQND